MVNNAQKSRRDMSEEKHGTERQKLTDELSFLSGLISKHKEKPAVKKSDVPGRSTNQFSWTKPSSSSSQSSTSSFYKQGQRSQNPHHLPARESLTWKKPEERSTGHLTTPATRYKYVAKDVQKLKPGSAIERRVEKVSFEKGEADVCKEVKTSAASSLGQSSRPKDDVQSRRTMIPQQGNKSLLQVNLTPSEISKTGIPSGKPLSGKPEFKAKSESLELGRSSRKTTSVNHDLQGSSSGDSSAASHRSKSNRRVVLPSSQKASMVDAPRSHVNVDVGSASLRNDRRETSSVKPSSFSEAQTCRSTRTTFPQQHPGIPQHQKGSSEHHNAKVLATLSKELDKCLGDIAKLKKARAQLNLGKSPSNAAVGKAPGLLVRQTNSETNSEKNAAPDSDQQVRSIQESISKSNNRKNKSSDSKSVKSVSGRSTNAATSSYKWIAPKVASENLSTSHGKEISNSKAETVENHTGKATMHVGADIGTGTNNLNAVLKTSKQISSPQVNVIRTKYKMKKQLSTSSTTSSSSISQHKIDHRKTVVTPAVKLPVQTCVPKSSTKMNRYKLVKSFSSPDGLLVGQPSTSSSSTQKRPVAINSRYKKVKGFPTPSGNVKKSAIIIPHRSQLKLNRIKSKPYQRNAVKRASSSTPTRKQSRHKIDRRPGKTVVRSRFKMQKVSNRTPRKAPPKQSSNSSPFKWQAKKLTPPKSTTPDTFMRRRMRFVITHTPVLLRTRFRLINSQHINSTTDCIPKQPLLKKTRTKLVRRSVSTPSSSSQKHSRSRVINAKGVHYHQSRSGKSLRRISSPLLPSPTLRTPSASRLKQGSLSRVWTASVQKVYQRQGVTKVSSTQWVANRVLRRTIQGKIQRGNRNLKSQPYCKFYNRYGRCHRGDKCPYIHDPDKVAVCTQFLRGTCKKTDGSCPFSHKVSKDKMPVCVYFLKGVCNRDNCPYSHVKVSKKAEVCQEFLHGYCPRGAKCKKKHTLDCAEFNETGQCKLGNRCPLWHRGRKNKSEGRKGVKRRPSEGEKVSSKRSTAQDRHTSKSKQGEAPLEERFTQEDTDDASETETDERSGSMPSFIALDSDSNQSTPEDSMWKKRSFGEDGGRPALKIRPLFALSMGASTSHQGQGRDTSSSTSSLLKSSLAMVTRCSQEEEDTHPS